MLQHQAAKKHRHVNNPLPLDRPTPTFEQASDVMRRCPRMMIGSSGVKVISSTTNLQDEVFKRAVEGLIRICFP